MEVNTKTKEVEAKQKIAATANDDLVKYKDHLEYLAMKDQCFEVVDGQFSYSLCMLGSITQKEVSGSREVTLGTHQSIEPAYDTPSNSHNGRTPPSTIMRFGGGQHCHAFGARTAQVTVACAAKNALISASEPSTCAYSLYFESPVACTLKYAQLNGLDIA